MAVLRDLGSQDAVLKNNAPCAAAFMVGRRDMNMVRAGLPAWASFNGGLPRISRLPVFAFDFSVLCVSRFATRCCLHASPHHAPHLLARSLLVLRRNRVPPVKTLTTP